VDGLPKVFSVFNWKTLSVVVGVTWWNFRLFPGSVRSPQLPLASALSQRLRVALGNRILEVLR